ncbi:septal ring lytic transglycosylase RlpA family protein [Ramlibacter sp. 2FC]|uniref:septal ring lytic transglycosylase RlpA family protein n=1 Tax=Ramlibacter sp. 2FC TaxID=2502188 RepID=UPI00201D9C66|nr:septal ring lytic transglycosylase RlpA family protein [Ramlibacter sp. 2FC]
MLRAALLVALAWGLSACTTLQAPQPGEAPPSGAPAARPATRAAGKPAAKPDAPADMAEPAAPDAAGSAALRLDDGLPELERGTASWYGLKFHGRRTASGERFDMNEFTAAHRTLPFGTLVRVRSLVNGREVEVRINDRGPHVAGRIIDLSRAAAEALGMLGLGMKSVTLSVVGQAQEPQGQELQSARPAPRAKAPRRKRPSGGPRR